MGRRSVEIQRKAISKPGKMKKRPLGRTGLKVSEVAFGGVGIGMPYAGQAMPAEKDSIRLLHQALDEGINYYDTARMYGVSEEIMGKAFGGQRDQVILNTKCVHFLDGQGRIPTDLPIKQTICDSLEKSLNALRTDYIDVFMLHQSSPELLQNEEVAAVFLDLKAEGKVRSIGASTYTPEESRLCIESGIWEVIQVPFNLMDQRQKELFPLVQQHGIGLIIRSVLFRGFLTGKSLKLHPALKAVEEHLRKFGNLPLSDIPGLIALAIKFVLSYPAVTSVLVGMDQKDHLTQALEVVDGQYFGPEFLSQLEEMAYPEPEFLNFSQWVKNGWLEN